MKGIKIYVADTSPLKDCDLFEERLSLLSEEIQIRVAQKKKSEEKRHTLGAALLLRHALLQEGISSFALFKGTNGKPYLKGEGMPFFNISHSKDRVMCVLSDRPVGCDVQWMDPRISLSVANRFFSKQEYDWIQNEPNEEARRLLFYRIWTLKESFAKMTGEGVLKTFQTFSVLPEKESYRVLMEPQAHFPCFFEPYAEVQYRYAVCGEKESIGPVQLVVL